MIFDSRTFTIDTQNSSALKIIEAPVQGEIALDKLIGKAAIINIRQKAIDPNYQISAMM